MFKVCPEKYIMTKVAIKETGIETPMIIDDRMLRKKINTITIEIKAANSIFVVTELMEVRTTLRVHDHCKASISQ